MILDRKGLLHGERIGACSDEAQLHFPRLLAAANGFARLELDVKKIIVTVYGSFRRRPTERDLAEWLKEYRDNFLLFIYEASDGGLWGQFDVPEKCQERYKDASTKRSPEPEPAALSLFFARHKAAKTKRHGLLAELIEQSGPAVTQRLPFSESFRNVSKVFANFQTSALGIGIGIGEGTEKENAREDGPGSEPPRESPAAASSSPPAPPPRPDPNPDDLSAVAQVIILAHPRAKLRHWTPADVTYTDRIAVVEAIRAEAEQRGITKQEAGLLILKLVNGIAAKVPEDQWRWLKDIAEFMRLREYRIDPKQLTRGDQDHGKNREHHPAGTRLSPAAERQRNSHDAIRAAAARRYGLHVVEPDGRDAGGVPEAGAPPGNAGHVADAVGDDRAEVQPGVVPGRIIEAAG